MIAGECGGAKFPLLRALNTALVARTEGAAAAAEVTARCEAAAYTEPPATKRPRVTRKPWVPRVSSAPTPASSSSAAVQESPSESGEHQMMITAAAGTRNPTQGTAEQNSSGDNYQMF